MFGRQLVKYFRYSDLREVKVKKIVFGSCSSSVGHESKKSMLVVILER